MRIAVAAAGAVLGLVTGAIAIAGEKPSVTISSISPPAGTVVDHFTVLKVVLEYRLPDAAPDVAYFVHPLFNSLEAGRSFNALKRLSDGLVLSKSSGTVEYGYPITAEWGDRKLAKPVVVTFCVMQRTGSGSAKSIAETQPVTYQASK